MIELAEQYGLGPVSVESLSAKLGISGKYIHVLVGGLKASQLIASVRGPSGGYELLREPSSITALDVIVAVEGRLAPVECTCRDDVCVRTGRCVAREVWSNVATVIENTLAGMSLDRLAVRQYHHNERSDDVVPGS
jgi:Rrf2 family protein